MSVPVHAKLASRATSTTASWLEVDGIPPTIRCCKRAALRSLAGRASPHPFRKDDTGTVRLLGDSLSFPEVVQLSLAMIRRNADGATDIYLALLRTLRDLAPSLRREADREALRALLRENAGAKPRPDAVERLDEAIADARFQLRFNRDGAARFEPASAGLDDALGRILETVVTAQHTGDWTRLKACGLASCRRAFWDASKSRTTKWCTARCGDRVRSERYRGTDKFRERQKGRE